jgi:hypothetical protein
MLALVLALAATVTDGPCGLVDKALRQDHREPTDAGLREAAAQAEDAGDILLATTLLARLRDRTKDPAVAAEASYVLATLDPRRSEFTCRGLTRDLLVYFDPASLLSEQEREAMMTMAGDDLDRRDVTAVFDDARAFEDCIELDDRCVRLLLADRRLGGVLRIKGVRIDDTVTVELTAVGFPGRMEQRFVLPDDVRRWEHLLDRSALDDIAALMPKGAGRARRAGAVALDPVIAGATAIGLGLVTAGVGAALWLEPGLAGAEGRQARAQWQTGGLVAAGVGATVALASSVALALIVDARNDG